MAERLRRILSELAGLWNSWPLGRQVGTLISLAAGVAVFAFMLSWASGQNYVPMLTGLTEEDAAQIVARLDAEHISYRLAAGGTAIMVPEEVVHQARLNVAGAGLPRGGNVGFELFDTPSFGMSRFTEQLNYRRGLEGELRRSIRQIEAIRDARVHIVVPERGLFREQDSQASAAVTLHLQPGRTLGPGQVQAIVHLVSSSVGQLSPERVTVVDQRGVILAKGGDQGGQLSSALEQQRVVELQIEERVAAILAPIVGQGHVVVRASATLDFSRNEKHVETYDPAQTVLRSDQTNLERRAGPGAAGAGGVPGARSNLSGIDSATQSAATGGAEGERRSETHNYEISKVMSHEVGAMGRLVRLSVAVLVDGIASPATKDGKAEYKEREPAELARFSELVRRAIGFDADRDDQVVVQSMPFETPVVEPEEVVVVSRLWTAAQKFWPAALAAVMSLVVAVALLRKRPAAAVDRLFDTPRSLREMEQSLNPSRLSNARLGALAGGPTRDLAAAGALHVPPGVAASLASLEPKRAAGVLKGWLNE